MTIPEDIKRGMQRVQERHDRFDSRAIGKAWEEMGYAEPKANRVTHKGVAIEIERIPHRGGRVEYDVRLEKGKSKVGRFWCSGVQAGRVQVTNAQIADGEEGGRDWRRQGIATSVYELIDADIRRAGGGGVEPHFGSMSDEAIAFWEARRPEWKGKMDRLNAWSIAASGLFD